VLLPVLGLGGAQIDRVRTGSRQCIGNQDRLDTATESKIQRGLRDGLVVGKTTYENVPLFVPRELDEPLRRLRAASVSSPAATTSARPTLAKYVWRLGTNGMYVRKL
jgi:hypothetical protein